MQSLIGFQMFCLDYVRIAIVISVVGCCCFYHTYVYFLYLFN